MNLKFNWNHNHMGITEKYLEEKREELFCVLNKV